MKQIELREGARRQHRTIALFGVIQCWQRGLDAICFERRHIERLVGIKRFRGTRVKWLKEDLKVYFPHLKTLVFQSDSFHSIVASRVPLDPEWPEGRMNSAERTRLLTARGVKSEVFQLWNSVPTYDLDFLKGRCDVMLPFFSSQGNTDERLMNAYLDLLASGAISPAEVLRAVSEKHPEPDEE